MTFLIVMNNTLMNYTYINKSSFSYGTNVTNSNIFKLGTFICNRGMKGNKHTILGNNSFGKVRNFKYIGSLLTNQNSIQ